MPNFFESPFKGIPLQEQVANPNITAGMYSCYSGYYHGHSFDASTRYLRSDEETQDKLIIGAYCSLGFMLAGNQGHRPEWVSTSPFHYFDEPAFKGRRMVSGQQARHVLAMMSGLVSRQYGLALQVILQPGFFW